MSSPATSTDARIEIEVNNALMFCVDTDAQLLATTQRLTAFIKAEIAAAEQRGANEALSEAADESARLHALVRAQQWSWKEEVSKEDQAKWTQLATLGTSGWLRSRRVLS